MQGQPRRKEGQVPACWGQRAGYFYYVGLQAGYDATVLEAIEPPKSPQIIKDLE